MMMNEDELTACKLDASEWKCPEPSCQKVLSRRQTLKTHLRVMHDIIAGKPGKTYKVYEYDPSVPKPRSTLNAHKKRQSAIEARSLSEPESIHEREDTTYQHNHAVKEGSIPLEDDTCDDLNMDTNDTQIHTDDERELEGSTDNDEDTSESESNLEEFDYCDEEESEEEEEEEADDYDDEEEKKSIFSLNDQPLYVGSKHTRLEYLQRVSEFSRNSKLSKSAIKDLLPLLQLHLPKINNGKITVKEIYKINDFEKTM